MRTGAKSLTALLAIAVIAALLASCGAAAPVPVQTSRDDHSVVADGDVIVHVPAHHSDIGVVVLHSLGSSAAEPPEQGWSRLSDSKGFVGIYPERGDSWNAGLCCGAAAAENRNDVVWLARVIAEARSNYGLKTFYLAGFSNGGMMVERLVVERPEVSQCFAVWGAAPEMPKAGDWPGSGHHLRRGARHYRPCRRRQGSDRRPPYGHVDPSRCANGGLDTRRAYPPRRRPWVRSQAPSELAGAGLERAGGVRVIG